MQYEPSSVADTAVKIAPTVPGGLFIAGVSLPDWVAIGTLVWLAMLMAGWVYDRLIKPWRQRRWDRKVAESAKARHASGRGPRG